MSSITPAAPAASGSSSSATPFVLLGTLVPALIGSGWGLLALPERLPAWPTASPADSTCQAARVTAYQIITTAAEPRVWGWAAALAATALALGWQGWRLSQALGRARGAQRPRPWVYGLLGVLAAGYLGGLLGLAGLRSPEGLLAFVPLALGGGLGVLAAGLAGLAASWRPGPGGPSGPTIRPGALLLLAAGALATGYLASGALIDQWLGLAGPPRALPLEEAATRFNTGYQLLRYGGGGALLLLGVGLVMAAALHRSKHRPVPATRFSWLPVFGWLGLCVVLGLLLVTERGFLEQAGQLSRAARACHHEVPAPGAPVQD